MRYVFRTKLVFSLLIALFLFSASSTAYAAPGPLRKLGRGIVHVVASPFQIPKEVIETTGEGETIWLAPWKGMTEGAGAGIYQCSRQILSGLADILTFWTPAGRDWAPIVEPTTLFPQI